MDSDSDVICLFSDDESVDYEEANQKDQTCYSHKLIALVKQNLPHGQNSSSLHSDKILKLDVSGDEEVLNVCDGSSESVKNDDDINGNKKQMLDLQHLKSYQTTSTTHTKLDQYIDDRCAANSEEFYDRLIKISNDFDFLINEYESLFENVSSLNSKITELDPIRFDSSFAKYLNNLHFFITM